MGLWLTKGDENPIFDGQGVPSVLLRGLRGSLFWVGFSTELAKGAA